MASAKSTPEWPLNHRDDRDVAKACMVGAMACPNCGHVHIDLVGADGRIFATAKISIEQWLDLGDNVADGVDRIVTAADSMGPVEGHA